MLSTGKRYNYGSSTKFLSRPIQPKNYHDNVSRLFMTVNQTPRFRPTRMSFCVFHHETFVQNFVDQIQQCIIELLGSDKKKWQISFLRFFNNFVQVSDSYTGRVTKLKQVISLFWSNKVLEKKDEWFNIFCKKTYKFSKHIYSSFKQFQN